MEYILLNVPKGVKLLRLNVFTHFVRLLIYFCTPLAYNDMILPLKYVFVAV